MNVLNVLLAPRFAREGANVFVSRRTLAPVARLAREITSAGGLAPPK
jgi:hypothetical protein